MPSYIVVYKNKQWIVKRNRPCNWYLTINKNPEVECFEVEAGCREKALKKARAMLFLHTQEQLKEKGSTVSQTTQVQTESK